MGTELGEYDEIIEGYISFTSNVYSRRLPGGEWYGKMKGGGGFADVEIAMSRMNLSSVDQQQEYEETEEDQGLQLLVAALQDDQLLVLNLLASNPALIFYNRLGGNTVLHLAAMQGNRSYVDKLINVSKHSVFQVKSPLLVENEEGRTALHLAIQYGHKEVASDLVKALPVPEMVYVKKKDGCTPITMAMQAGYRDLVEDMLKRAPWSSLCPRDRESLLESTIVPDAIEAKDIGMLQILLDNMPALAEPHSQMYTPLSYAIIYGHIDKVRYLLEKFPDCVNEPNDSDLYPIHDAIDYGQVDAVKEIISHYPHVMNQGKVSPLSYAAYRGHLGIVRLFITKFPEYVSISDEDGFLPLHRAAASPYPFVDVVKELLSFAPETLFRVDGKGRSVLHCAVMATRHDVFSFLRTKPEIKKIFHLKDVDGKTFIDLMNDQMVKKNLKPFKSPQQHIE